MKNDTSAFKGGAFISTDLKPIIEALPSFPKNGTILDGAANRKVPFKVEGDALLVQGDFLPGGTYSFTAVAEGINFIPAAF